MLTEKGIAAGQDGKHWVFTKIVNLIDGFRTIRSILSDSPFFPHRTQQVLVAAVRQGWIRKTVFPELKEVDEDNLSQADADGFCSFGGKQKPRQCGRGRQEGLKVIDEDVWC